MGSFNFHEQIMDYISKNVDLESLLGFKIKSIEKNLVVNLGMKDNFELDFYILGFENSQEVIFEIKSNAKLRRKFNKQLIRFENYFPNADIYFIYSKDGFNHKNLTFEYLPNLSRFEFEYY